MNQVTTQASVVIPSDLKVENRKQVLNAFLDGAEYSAGEIAQKTGISRQTVKKAVRFFLDKQMLEFVGKGEPGGVGGKKPELYSIPKEKYFIFVVMGPDAISVSLVNMRGNTVDRYKHPEAIPRNAQDAFSLAGELINILLDKNEADKSALVGAAVATGGIVNYDTKQLKYNSVFPEWGVDIPVVDYLRPFMGVAPVFFIENAGKMAGRSLTLEKELYDKRVLAVFSTGGLSACLIENGRVLNGKASLIGEIGHMIIDPMDKERCSCGSHGCVERLVSMERIRSIIRSEIGEHPDSLLNSSEKITYDILFEASASGDVFARRIIDYIARMLSITLRNITLTFDPDVIVFQGSYAHADEYFSSRINADLSEFNYFPEGGAFEIRYDKRPLNDLVILGATKSLLDEYFSDPEHYTDSND